MLESLPQNAVVANRLLSSGGAHLAQIPWQAGYDTPWRIQYSQETIRKCLNNLIWSPASTCEYRHIPQQGPGISSPVWHSCNGSGQRMGSACWGWMWPLWQSQRLLNTQKIKKRYFRLDDWEHKSDEKKRKQFTDKGHWWSWLLFQKFHEVWEVTLYNYPFQSIKQLII